MTAIGWICPVCGTARPPQLDRCCTVEVPQVPRPADVVALGSKTNRQKPKRLDYSDYPDFEAFWNNYPQKRDKRAALAAWITATASGAAPQTIIAAAKRYAAWCAANDVEARHIKYAQGWLNHERWTDEVVVPAAVGETDPAYIVGTPEYEARQVAEGVW